MMRDPQKTIGNLIDKQKVSFSASISEEGFPNMKAMLAPRKREGIKEFWFSTNTSSMRVGSNIASCRTIERLGGELVEICTVPREYFAWREGMERRRVYRLAL